jgi:adenylate cyclase
VTAPPREVEVALLMADLSGYTALTEAHGNLDAAQVLRRYVELAGGALVPGARLVERVGDELVVAAARARDAVETALRLRAAITGEPRFPIVRAGVHLGTVLEEGGRLVGGALNIAARVVGRARAGQILCTRPVVDAAGAVPGVRFRALGPARLRNVPHPLELYEVEGGEAARAGTIDPVCRMQVDPATAAARAVVGGRAYHFCSVACRDAFVADPDAYGA